MKIICIGNLKEEYLKDGVSYFIQKINKVKNIEIIQLDEERVNNNPSKKDEISVMHKEGLKILSHVNKNDYVINLCIEGKTLSTMELREHIKQCEKEIVFIIGGSLGLSIDVVKRGNLNISFSRMTFPHQLMRLILLEQIANII